MEVLFVESGDFATEYFIYLILNENDVSLSSIRDDFIEMPEINQKSVYELEKI
ncbi:hypothetical protein ACSSV9_06650 [Melioribacter sp. OK-6-Me]|uniref:hypothetical protein n=1 Tax=Melioribacter sp. OK-6-Me TaxID=3423433 RepID=UPI003EDA8C3D